MFRDRKDAGEKLAETLHRYKNAKDAVVISIPRGGVVIGHILAQKLHLPLDIALVKKLGHPFNGEYAIGAANPRDYILDDHLQLPESYVKREVQKVQKFLRKRYEMYYGTKKPLKLNDKTVIIVDDGLATGNTMLAAIKLIKLEKPAKIVVAVPMAPDNIFKKLGNHANEIFCLETHQYFDAVGLYYHHFEQVSDEEVKHLLHSLSASKKMT